MLQLLIAEWWAKWLGIELNDGKRELPCASTRHLGFEINLKNKFVGVTEKHSRRFVVFFSQFMLSVKNNGRIPIRDLQKILGLQIWIRTVFRVLRQFLTSTCDALRVSQGGKFLYPRKHKELVARMIFDLK